MKRGFTLMEVLIAMLVMGLVSTGLLNLLHWGRLRYQAIDEGWRERTLLKTLHQSLRREISAGNLAAVQSMPGRFSTLFPSDPPVLCTSMVVRAYASDTVFVKPQLFIDRNRNGREDPPETLPPHVWCFRIRSRP